MTPERQRWWDSLPAEEKRVRSFIAAEKSTIKVAKATINSEDCDVDYEKNAISASKQLLKALRKQIAMSPLELFAADGTTDKLCPCCYKMVFALDKYCRGCGQKLRWKKCVD